MPEREFFGHPKDFEASCRKVIRRAMARILGLTLPALLRRKERERKKENSGQAAGADLAITSPTRGRTIQLYFTSGGRQRHSFQCPALGGRRQQEQTFRSLLPHFLWPPALADPTLERCLPDLGKPQEFENHIANNARSGFPLQRPRNSFINGTTSSVDGGG